MGCKWVEVTHIHACSSNEHGEWNIEEWGECEASTKPYVYTTMVYQCTEQEDPQSPGGGGGTGGGGGSDTPPATSNPCNGGSGGVNDQPQSPNTTGRQNCGGVPTTINIVKDTDPCEKIKVQRTDDNFKNKIADLQDKTGLKKETGYIQKFGGDYDYKDNASATDDHNALSLPQASTNTYIKGFMHTHVNDYTYTDLDGNEGIRKGIKIFSPADVSYFMDLLKTAQDATRPLGDVYAVMISNTANYQIRFTGNQYQIKTFTDAQKDTFRDMYTDFMKDRIGNQKN